MDMTRMPLKDHSFDIVIEKATLDSLLVTAKSPWNFQSEENLLGNFFSLIFYINKTIYTLSGKLGIFN